MVTYREVFAIGAALAPAGEATDYIGATAGLADIGSLAASRLGYVGAGAALGTVSQVGNVAIIGYGTYSALDWYSTDLTNHLVTADQDRSTAILNFEREYEATFGRKPNYPDSYYPTHFGEKAMRPVPAHAHRDKYGFPSEAMERHRMEAIRSWGKQSEQEQNAE